MFCDNIICNYCNTRIKTEFRSATHSKVTYDNILISELHYRSIFDNNFETSLLLKFNKYIKQLLYDAYIILCIILFLILLVIIIISVFGYPY